MEDGIHDRRPLLVVVDKLPLVGRTDVEQTAVGPDLPALVVVAVAVKDLTEVISWSLIFMLFSPYQYSRVQLHIILVIYDVICLIHWGG